MGRIKKLLRSRTARTTVLLAGLVAAALYADAHVKGDMDLAQENAICHSQRQQMMNYIAKSDQAVNRLSTKVKEYEKVMEGTEYAGLRVIAAAVHPRQIVLQLMLNDKQVDFSFENCKQVIGRFERLKQYVRAEEKFDKQHKPYLLGVIMFEQNFFQKACGKAARDRFL